VSEWSKERDWKSRTCCKVRRGFKSRPLRSQIAAAAETASRLRLGRVSSSWNVWARALGTPGGSAIQTTCAASFIDTVAGEIFCSSDSAMYFRTKGKSTFTDVTSLLLFLTVTIDSTATPGLATCLGVTGTQSVTVSLFNSCFQNYFWNYDNNGLKLLQLRFYPAS
jgi:hypothetical protein